MKNFPLFLILNKKKEKINNLKNVILLYHKIRGWFN